MINKLLLVYFTLQIIILIHELGHLCFAKYFRYPISEINIGFGKILFGFTFKDLNFKFRLFPLGGFICIENLGDNDHWFSATMTYLGGIIFNILLAFLCMIFTLQLGIKTQFAKVLDVTKQTTMITEVNNQYVNNWIDVNNLVLWAFIQKRHLSISLQNGTNKDINTDDFSNFFNHKWLETNQLIPWQPTVSPIIKYSNNPLLMPNDRILKVNNITVKNNHEFQKFILYNPNKILNVLINRDNQEINIQLRPKPKKSLELISLGNIDVKLYKQKWPQDDIIVKQYAFPQSILQSFLFVIDKISLQFLIILQLIQGKLTIDMLSGPIGIYKTIYNSIDFGLVGYLYTLSILSIAVAIINLIPVPPTDGFFIIVKSIESMTNIKISNRYLILLQHIALIIIFLLVINISLHEIEKYILDWKSEVANYEV